MCPRVFSHLSARHTGERTDESKAMSSVVQRWRVSKARFPVRDTAGVWEVTWVSQQLTEEHRLLPVQ